MGESRRTRAVTIEAPGPPDVLRVEDVELPATGEHDIVIDVVAAGVNGADTVQRKGLYPPPPGAPTWLGLEVSGTVAATGQDVETVRPGDVVCALLPGGGYAHRVVVHEGLVLPVPTGVGVQAAAALPEVMATVWSNVVMLAELRRGETLVVHGGSSGVGTAAIQVGCALGAQVVATAGSPQKVALCEQLGAVGVSYREQDFVEEVLRATDGRGADVVLDMVGGDYVARDLAALALDGRIMLIADRRGTPLGVSAGDLMARRARIWGTTLRSRTLEERCAIIAQLRDHVWPMIESGAVRPVVGATLPLEEAADAHRLLESSEHTGKILLTVQRA